MRPSVNFNGLIARGALVALLGFVLSGPVAFGIVLWLTPQPPWDSPAVFAEHYHPFQNLPYLLGFLLIAGMLMVVAGHYLSVAKEKVWLKGSLLLAVFASAVFATLITFNYICQTTFVHNMAIRYKPDYDAAITAFSMSNPTSFCWANEMWGYAILGVATWLMSGYYRERSRTIQWLLVVNGIASIATALWTIVDVYWVLTTAGLIAYLIWNVLMMVLMILIRKDAGRELAYPI